MCVLSKAKFVYGDLGGGGHSSESGFSNLFSMGFLSITKLSKAIPFTQVKFLSGGVSLPRLLPPPLKTRPGPKSRRGGKKARDCWAQRYPTAFSAAWRPTPDSLSLLDADSWAGELLEAGLRRGAQLGQGIVVLSRIVK